MTTNTIDEQIKDEEKQITILKNIIRVQGLYGEHERKAHYEKYLKKHEETIQSLISLKNKGELEMKKLFDEQIRKAINEHGAEHIDIIVEGSDVHGMYHSRHNSFGVTDTFPLSELGGIAALEEYEDEFEPLCVCVD